MQNKRNKKHIFRGNYIYLHHILLNRNNYGKSKEQRQAPHQETAE